MYNLDRDLKKKVYGLINKKDIKDIIFLLARKYELTDYVKGVEFSFEEFNGVSHEDAINYDEFEKTIIVNMPQLHDKFIELTDNEIYVLNWMIMFDEIIYALENVRLYKVLSDKTESPETKLLKIYDEYKKGNKFLKKYPFLYNYHSSKKTSDKLEFTPTERIKYVNAYFKTQDIFKELHLKSPAPLYFARLNEEKLLDGYDFDDQSKYPIKEMLFNRSYLEGLYFIKKFDWYNNEPMMTLSNATDEVTSVKDRLALGYPIDLYEHILIRKNKM